MTNTKKFAQQELDILAATNKESIIIPFTKEILALCDAFEKRGISRKTTPHTVSVISQAFKSLMMMMPISPVTGEDSEWEELSQMDDDKNLYYQNKRCSALFKNTKEKKATYLDAIIWNGKEGLYSFTGVVYIDETLKEVVGSRHFVKFPFTPKSFYIDVERVLISKEDAESRKLYYTGDGTIFYYFIIKDKKQLDEVFKYYIKNEIK
jgi:hypothetical protein